MCLSGDWDGRVSHKVEGLITSNSDGSICSFKFTNGSLEHFLQWQAHDFEAWIAAYDYWHTNVVFTGGDDSKLKGWDLRSTPNLPIFTSKEHSMGVCSVQSNPHREHLFVSGSYDECICLWDQRRMRTPVSKVHTGGGVWRLKWHPSNSDLLLAACMHYGCRVISSAGDNLTNLCEYTKHNSMAYGADWSRQSQGIIASCSFYDRAVHVWELPGL
mmetsp:Transcript_22863/g.37628  ORF Transcript_22863/g.37628 Transcript_22863/m.37628 type:complete len:215 (-) Transcript_22863:54-698(-)